MKHTVVICITVLLLAFGGGYLAQQELVLQDRIAQSTFAKDRAYYDLEHSKFQFEVTQYTVQLKEYLDTKAKAEEAEVHASPTPPSPPNPNLRADNTP